MSEIFVALLRYVERDITASTSREGVLKSHKDDQQNAM